jgi:hypothetical protein
VTVAADELLERAIAAQGGSERFDSASEISVRLRCSGWALALKLKRGALADFTGTISTTEPRAVLAPYPKQGRRGVLERNSVRIESDGGEVLAERADPRAAIRSFRRNFWWDDLDLLYFATYALWGYMSAPFVFRRPGFEVDETEPWREDGEVWQGLQVRFPEDVPAHSREQRYYFDDRGLIRRNDYTAEVFGRWAKATHYCWDHEEFSGLVVPTRRKAMPRRRNGKPRRAIALVSIAIDDVRPR